MPEWFPITSVKHHYGNRRSVVIKDYADNKYYVHRYNGPDRIKSEGPFDALDEAKKMARKGMTG